ncbi:hypothetical protein BX666DRAFT_1877390 [Dichotomocladium elegans]|nr:hypothetical protein BX666DRAFT_1877390 [Dichotomocladium elegans]
MADIYDNSSLPPLTPQHRYSFAEDTDSSETDTVLNTPTGWSDLSPSNSPSSVSHPRWSLASTFSTAFSRHGYAHKVKRHSDLPKARLLTTIYRFEASRQDHSPSILEFINCLKAHLEDWAEHPTMAAHRAATRRAIKHMARRPDLTDVVFRKVERRRRRRREQQQFKEKRRRRQQEQQLSQDNHHRETGEDQERVLMDAIHAAQAPLLTEVTELQRNLDGLRDEKDDVEQTLAEVQHELQLVLDELDHEKQQTVEYRTIIARLESHLHAVELHDEQDDDNDVSVEKDTEGSPTAAIVAIRYKESLERNRELEAESSHLRHSVERLKIERENQKALVDQRLRRHTEDLRRAREALADAEKRVAEGELKLEVAKSLARRQQKSLEQQLAEAVAARQEQERELAAAAQSDQQAIHQPCRDVETALSREVAKREAQLAQLERTLQQVTEQQHRDRGAWERRMRDELSAVYMQEKEVYKVQISRELRALASQTAEQETEIESLERRYGEAAAAATRAEALRKQVEEKCADQMHQYEKNEQDLRNTILQLTQKLSSLEHDSLKLFSRNIELAQQLGLRDP